MQIEDLLTARTRIQNWLKPTPLLPSERTQAHQLWLKLETQNPTGSFKFRPAMNGILAHLERARTQGILSSSSGNFAQAVAYAAALTRCSSQIVMMNTTSEYKISKTRALGAEVTLCEATFKDRWDTTYRIQRETGRLLLHPYDSEETIAGDGSIGLELLEQLPGDFSVLVPVSGGGLLAGIALAIKSLRPTCRVYGVQPSQNASMKKSLIAHHRVEVPAFQSIADALVAVTPGERTFTIVDKLVDDILLVEESEIVEAIRYLYEERKLVAEPGAAVSVAAARAERFKAQLGKQVVGILSGGNISIERLNQLIST